MTSATAGCTGWNSFPAGRQNADIPPARLIDGARRGPLEDSGGLPGYEAIMDALADPSHSGHAACAAWVADVTGSDAPFEPALFDITAVNRALADQF